MLKYALIPLFVCSPVFAFAQTVSVHKIYERRSTTSGGPFDNKCEIELKIAAEEAQKYKFVKISKLTTVTDDQGVDLLKEDAYEADYEKIRENSIVKFETRLAARTATVLKEIAGEISLYNPSETNGSVVKIANYSAKTNTNLVPASVGVQVMYLTKESMEKYVQEQKQKREEELKKLPEEARKKIQELMQAFEGLSDFNSDPSQATFYVSGDEGKLVDLYFEDAKGKRVGQNSRFQSGNIVSYSWDEKLDSAWKLVLNLETAATVKKVPFKLSATALIRPACTSAGSIKRTGPVATYL